MFPGRRGKLLVKVPKLIFGDDNGFCSLWDIDLETYNDYRERIEQLESEERDEECQKLETEFYDHKINISTEEEGYVPDWATYLAECFKIDVESN
jgi:hypothetical protein